MIDVEAECHRRGDVTCVRATVANVRNTPQRVELRSTLDGPVWAPRAEPLAVPEWLGSTWVGVVPAGESRGLGFATAADPVDDPVEVVSVERAEDGPRRPTDPIVDLESSSPPSSVVSRGP